MDAKNPSFVDHVPNAFNHGSFHIFLYSLYSPILTKKSSSSKRFTTMIVGNYGYQLWLWLIIYIDYCILLNIITYYYHLLPIASYLSLSVTIIYDCNAY